jgi:HlyD family secretion protein
MAHVTDAAPDTAHNKGQHAPGGPGRDGRPGAPKPLNSDERARMRLILSDMGQSPASITSDPSQSPIFALNPAFAPRHRRWPVAVAGALVLAAAAVVGGSGADGPVKAGMQQLAGLFVPQAQPNTTGGGAQPTPAAQPAAPASTVPADGTVLEASGKVVAKREAMLSSDLTGQIVSIAVTEGDRVTAGQEIARLDTRVAAAQLAVADANVLAATRERAIVVVERDALLDDLDRAGKLTKRGIVSQEQLSTLRGQYDVLEARLMSGDTQIDLQRLKLEAIRQDMNKTVIRAPFDGIVTDISSHLGEVVSPVGQTAETGIVTIIDPASIVSEIDVNEEFLSRIVVGQPVQMTVPAYPDRTFQGHVSLVTPVVNDSTAAIKVTVAFDDVPKDVYPGMRVDVAFSAPDT